MWKSILETSVVFCPILQLHKSLHWLTSLHLAHEKGYILASKFQIARPFQFIFFPFSNSYLNRTWFRLIKTKALSSILFRILTSKVEISVSLKFSHFRAFFNSIIFILFIEVLISLIV